MKRLNKINNENANALVITLIVIFSLLVIGGVFVAVSIGDYTVAERQLMTTKALYIAEAGIERAFYDLKQDFVNGGATPSFSDGVINIYNIGPDTDNWYPTDGIPYSSTSINGGSYKVQLKNVTGATDAVWVKSTGTWSGATQTLLAYVKLENNSVWSNAIFAGAGASGSMVNGNVNIRGSVHILGTGLSSSDYAINMGGTAELVGNNYNGFPASLLPKVPALPTTIFNGETVSTLNAKLRVKRGIVGISGSSLVGEVNVAGNSVKETIDGSYVSNGYGGTVGTAHVYSDNGWSNSYDMGNSISFPSLSSSYPGYTSYQAYLRANAYVTSAADNTTLANITPHSNFSMGDAKGTITMDGNGNMTVSGIVYIDNGGTLSMAKASGDTTIAYTGTGSILATGNVQIDLNLVTSGNNSFPSNILGIMTPGTIGFNEANISVMGLFYGETKVHPEKQTNIIGTIVSNYFDMGTNVPAIFQVPDTSSHLPPGIIGQGSSWTLTIVSWQKV